MKKTGISYSALVAAAVFLPLNLSAHHSVNSFYDLSDPIVVPGQLTSVRWANPHVLLQMERIEPDGTTVTWHIDSGGPTLLRRLGVTAELVDVGDQVTISGFPSKLNDHEMIGVSIALQDGREMPMFPTLAGRFGHEIRSGVHISETAAAAGERAADGIFRVWTAGRGPNRSAPEPAFKAAALAGRAAYDPLTDDLALQCIAPGMPIAMDNPFPIEFVQADDAIIVRLEVWDAVRTIHMTAEAADPAPAPSPLGHSIGRWEGETLVVETTAIDWPWFDDDGTPQSEQMEVVERFSLNADETRLDYEVVMTDAATLTTPAVRYDHWVWVPGEALQPYNCTLENDD